MSHLLCYGCRFALANQEAHMNYGGCLYSPEPDYTIATPFTQSTQDSPSNLSCAVCIVKDSHHDMFSTVSRASSGTMRCRDHHMQCANCSITVQSDTHLLCEGCSCSGAAQEFQEALFKRPTTDFSATCLYDTIKVSAVKKIACGCARCMQETAEYYKARALEEGFSERESLSGQNSPSSLDTTSVGFGVSK